MSLDFIDRLPTVFAVEYVEASLFRPEPIIFDDVGVWRPILERLVRAHTGQGECSGWCWEWDNKRVRFQHPTKSKSVAARLARWVTFSRIGDCKSVVVALVPHSYGSTGLHLDHRFVVATDDDTLIPMMLLLRDQLLE